MQYFLPANHLLAMLLQNLQHALIKISLQSVIVLDAFLFHEGLDLQISIPLLAFVFIAPNMHVSVREKPRHLTQKSVEKLVSLFASRIECRLEDAGAALDCERAGSTA